MEDQVAAAERYRPDSICMMWDLLLDIEAKGNVPPEKVVWFMELAQELGSYH